MNIKTFLDDGTMWQKLWEHIPKDTTSATRDDGNVIAIDTLIDIGVNLNDDNEDLIYSVRTFFEVGFLMGTAYEGRYEDTESIHPQQDRDPVDSSTTEYERVPFPSDEVEKLVRFPDSNIVEGVPKWLYFELLEKAAETFVNYADDPDQATAAASDAMLEAFKSVSSNEGERAETVVTRRAVSMARTAGE